MASIPNARQYRTNRTNGGSAPPYMQQQVGHHDDRSGNATLAGPVLALLVGAVLFCLFPKFVLTLVGLGLLVAWLSPTTKES